MSGNRAVSGSAEMEMQMEMQMQMNVGPSPSLASTSPLVRPMGISPSLREAEPGNWYEGNRWPPRGGGKEQVRGSIEGWLGGTGKVAAEPASGAHIEDREGDLPSRRWSAQFYSLAVLGEFVAAELADGACPPSDRDLLAHLRMPEKDRLKWDRIDLNPAKLRKPLDADGISRELDELRQLTDYRPAVLDEALAQCEGIDTYFRGILSFSPSSHPWTFGLMQIGLRTGEWQAMHYKWKFNRPRPSSFSPWLMPPIEVPGHASYPSGHSTQAHLVALLLAEVLPGEALGALQKLAARIARNREVLGLHYPSDSEAGVKLATGSFLLLRDCKTIKAIIGAAKAEWGA